MKKRKKLAKVVVTIVLAVALFTVQGLQIAANVNSEVDLSNPTVLVSDYDQLVEAVQNAQDGDVIGIERGIEIDGENLSIGSDDKHIYFVRTGEFGDLRVSNNGSLTVKNATFDGKAMPGQGAEIQVFEGSLKLDGVTLQRFDGNFGALDISGSSYAEINNCTFDTNISQNGGGHIYVQGSEVHIKNCSFINGHSYNQGGAIYIYNGTVTISDSIIYNNEAGQYSRYTYSTGGGIYNNGGTLNIDSTVIYDNAAPNGSDIANTKTSQFQIDSLEDVRELYEARDIIPKEWVIDNTNAGEDFDTSSSISLMKLVYEVKGEESSGTEQPSTEETPSTEQPSTEETPSTEQPSTEETPSTEQPSTEETPSTEQPSTEQPSTEETPSTEQPSTEETPSTEQPSTEEIPSTEQPSTEESSSTEQPSSEENKDNTNSDSNSNSGGSSTTESMTDNSKTDNSKTDNSKTTDSHNSTTNNYYTYNNSTDNTSAGKDSASETTSPTVNTVTVGSTSETKSANKSEPKEDTAIETKEDDEAATSVQMPDNIKLNLQYVDVVYEMVDGRSSIEISSPTEQAVNMASASQSTSDSTVFLDGAVTPMADVYNDSTNQRESSSIDWYEVIKILLLIALFIVVVPKPRWKMFSQNEIAVPEPEGNLKVQSEEETPRQEKKKKSKKHMEN